LQHTIWNATKHLQPFFNGGKKDGSWRSLEMLFKPPEDCTTTHSGCVNLSPGWFEQGHDVGNSLYISYDYSFHIFNGCQTEEDDLKPSASLKLENSNTGGRAWLCDIAESSALISAVLRVVHPDQYLMGRSAIEKMGEREPLIAVLAIWISVFNAVQILSNRETPRHRDRSSPPWYDILTTVGPYQSAMFELPGVGLRFPYNSGTIISLCGRILRHGVSEADGDRVCLAYYMRENVQRRLGSTFAGWSKRYTEIVT
jgi:hypothetical protein